MLAEGERPPAIQADHLEHAVAPQQAVVGDGDPRLGGRRDLPVDARELGDASLAWRAFHHMREERAILRPRGSRPRSRLPGPRPRTGSRAHTALRGGASPTPGW